MSAIARLQALERHLTSANFSTPSAEKKEKAAIKIQSVWRGYLGRIQAENIKRHLLSYSLFEKAKIYINDPSLMENLPTASSGRTPVYLPDELPIVLKRSGNPKNRERFEIMKQARELRDRSGYPSLDIPLARVYGEYIIESRLPIPSDDTKLQIGLYIENLDKFTKAVKEFTGFLCQSFIYDIAGGKGPYQSLCKKVSLGRYDNLALYLKEGEGVIGLVDIENFSLSRPTNQSDWCFFTCRDLIRLFPYHFDEILSVAEKFDPTIRFYREPLKEERDQVLQCFKLIYEDHSDFIRKKGITSQNPIEFEKLSPEKAEKLKNTMTTRLVEQDEIENDGWFKFYLKSDVEKTLFSFTEKAFPMLLNATYDLIDNLLKFNLERYENKNKSTINSIELIGIRTLFVYKNSEIYREFMNSLSNELEMLIKNHFPKINAKVFYDFLSNVLLEEMAKTKEIAYFSRDMGYYEQKCIFC